MHDEKHVRRLRERKRPKLAFEIWRLKLVGRAVLRKLRAVLVKAHIFAAELKQIGVRIRILERHEPHGLFRILRLGNVPHTGAVSKRRRADAQ